MRKDDSVINEITKDFLLKRGRVSLKLTSVANDLAARGRRHDNSYTDSVEMSLLIKLKTSETASDSERYNRLLSEIHSRANDYLPEYHDNDVSKMNMIQLLEYIADQIADFDKAVLSDNRIPNDIDRYKEFVLYGLDVSDDLRGVIESTVEYMVDRNKSIIKNLPKTPKGIDEKELLKIQEEINGETEEE